MGVCGSLGVFFFFFRAFFILAVIVIFRLRELGWSWYCSHVVVSFVFDRMERNMRFKLKLPLLNL